MTDPITIKDILDVLEDRVQWMRKTGETDLRGLMFCLSSIRKEVNECIPREEFLADWMQEGGE